MDSLPSHAHTGRCLTRPLPLRPVASALLVRVSRSHQLQTNPLACALECHSIALLAHWRRRNERETSCSQSDIQHSLAAETVREARARARLICCSGAKFDASSLPVFRPPDFFWPLSGALASEMQTSGRRQAFSSPLTGRQTVVEIDLHANCC